MIKIGQYNCIIQTASIKVNVFSRDMVSNIPFLIKRFMLFWDPTLGFMQCQDLLKFLEYLLGVEHDGDRNANGRRSIILMSSKV